MALALPDNGEVNNREVDRQRRLTTDSGGHAELDIDDDDEDEFGGELQNGEYDEEEPGMRWRQTGNKLKMYQRCVRDFWVNAKMLHIVVAGVTDIAFVLSCW